MKLTVFVTVDQHGEVTATARPIPDDVVDARIAQGCKIYRVPVDLPDHPAILDGEAIEVCEARGLGLTRTTVARVAADLVEAAFQKREACRGAVDVLAQSELVDDDGKPAAVVCLSIRKPYSGMDQFTRAVRDVRDPPDFEREMTDSLNAELKKLEPRTPGIQKVEIVLTSDASPDKVARDVLAELQKIGRGQDLRPEVDYLK